MTAGGGSSKVLEVDVRLPLDRFALEVAFRAERRVTGVFGASGAGKTSLLETIAGLRGDATGRVALGGHTWLDSARRVYEPAERRAIGYVPQDGLLFPHLDVRGNLLAGADRARRAGQRPEEALVRVAALFELEPLLDRAVATLSGGERQRVALGRALCSGPELLLLDEPLAALDLPLRRRLLPFLRRLCDELTVPMLLVSHDPLEVQALCDELIVLREGAILARGAPREVLTDPAVFPLAEASSSYQNVLTGRVAGSEDGTVTVAFEGSDLTLVVSVRQARVTVGETLLVSIPANEIVLATERPRALSARNVVPATVEVLRRVDGRVLVSTALAGTSLRVEVEVTDETPEALGLVPGGAVYLVLKATSCRLLAG